MKTEAEIEMTRPQAEGHPGPPGAGSGARDGLSLRASGRNQPSITMTLGFWPWDLQENGFLLF